MENPSQNHDSDLQALFNAPLPVIKQEPMDYHEYQDEESHQHETQQQPQLMRNPAAQQLPSVRDPRLQRRMEEQEQLMIKFVQSCVDKESDRAHLMNGKTSIHDVIIKTEPLSNQPLMPTPISNIRKTASESVQILNHQGSRRLASAVSMYNDQQSPSSSAINSNRSPLVINPMNPIFDIQATPDYVRQSRSNIPIDVRRTSQMIGVNLDTLEQEVEFEHSISCTIYDLNHRSLGSQTEVKTVETKKVETKECAMQTTDNSGDTFITKEQYAKLNNEDRLQFIELKKKMGIIDSSSIGAIKERLIHRKSDRAPPKPPSIDANEMNNLPSTSSGHQIYLNPNIFSRVVPNEPPIAGNTKRYEGRDNRSHHPYRR